MFASNWTRRRKSQKAQALVEFALISIPLALLLIGSIEFGLLYGHKIELANGARAGARWAALHPTAWAPNLPAVQPSNTIRGQVLGAGGTSTLTADDAHVGIAYYTVSGAVTTLCGRVVGGAWSIQNAIPQATCLTDGSLVTVTVTNSYPLLTSLFSSLYGPNVSLSAASTMVIVG